MKITPYVKWFDLWVGLYIDRPNKTLYIGIVPMVGIKVQLNGT